MILYHITSLEKPIQSILIPKIPDETEIGENYTEKRISIYEKPKSNAGE